VASLSKILTKRKEIIQDGIDRGFRDRSITEEDCRYLYELLAISKPRVVIEIGTWTGVSAMFLAECGAKVYTCDKAKAYSQKHSGIKYYNCWSTEFLKKIKNKGVMADLVLLDGRLLDCDKKRLLRVVKDKACIITHDYVPGSKGARNFDLLKRELTDIRKYDEIGVATLNKRKK